MKSHRHIGIKFCQICGRKLTSCCGSCGHQMQARASFCPVCGCNKNVARSKRTNKEQEELILKEDLVSDSQSLKGCWISILIGCSVIFGFVGLMVYLFYRTFIGFPTATAPAAVISGSISIKKMQVGDSGWINPEGLRLTKSGKCYLDGDALTIGDSDKKYDLRVERRNDGYYVFCSKSNILKWHRADSEGMCDDEITLKSFSIE